jgi:hypothetical protein
MPRKKQPRGLKLKQPFEMYYCAASYIKSATRLSEQTPRRPYFRPTIVFQVLSLEVFLKCLYCLRKRLVPKHHDLEQLFCRLRESDRKFIVANFDSKIIAHDGNRHSLTFGLVLNRCNRLFESVRYGYEGSMTDSDLATLTLGLDQAVHAAQALSRRLRRTYIAKTEARHLS